VEMKSVLREETRLSRESDEQILPGRKIKMSSSGIVDLKKWGEGIQKRAFLAKISVIIFRLNPF